MIVGQRVACINGDFSEHIAKFYTALPKKDLVYVIRRVSIGVSDKGELGEVCLYLVGLTNPLSETPPFPERGFNAERFRPLDEIKDKAREVEVVWASPCVTEERDQDGKLVKIHYS